MLFLGFALIQASCKDEKSPLTEFVNTAFPDLQNGLILVIPDAGCTGCITDAENSLNDFLKEDDNRVVFSEIQSVKTVKYRLKQISVNSEDAKVFVDSLNKFTKSTDEYKDLWGFPLHIQVENSKAVSINRAP